MGTRKEFEDIVEAVTLFSKTHRFISCPIFPSDVDLYEIDSVEVDDQGQVKLVLPWERDIIIPLELKEAQKLVNKLNELIPLAKKRKAAT